MKDGFGREINYMRISITDCCNLRCRYCRPDDITTESMSEYLSVGELEQICQEAVALGIVKFKITGGEPLIRRDCAEIIERIHRIAGVEQVTLTTNGILLKEHLSELMEAGINGINVSLDTLDPCHYQRLTGVDGAEKVKDGIFAAYEAGIPTKLNCVLRRELMEKEEWKPLITMAQKNKIDVRFIEMMPLGNEDFFEDVPASQLLEQLKNVWDGIVCDRTVHGNGPAVYYRIPGFQGSIGFIPAMHEKFCDSCNRIRITATGEVKSCLCYGEKLSLKEVLRGTTGVDKEKIRSVLSKAILQKPGAHCFEHPDWITEEKKMIQIGG